MEGRELGLSEALISTETQSNLWRGKHHEGWHRRCDANISIIEGTGASQLDIGVVASRIVEMIGRNEGAVVPIGSYQERFGVTLSLPSRLGREGVTSVLMPPLVKHEERALDHSAATLRRALRSIEP